MNTRSRPALWAGEYHLTMLRTLEHCTVHDTSNVCCAPGCSTARRIVTRHVSGGPDLGEVVEDGHALEVLHAAVQAAQGAAGAQPAEGLVQELDLLAGRREHQDLGLQPATTGLRKTVSSNRHYSQRQRIQEEINGHSKVAEPCSTGSVSYLQVCADEGPEHAQLVLEFHNGIGLAPGTETRMTTTQTVAGCMHHCLGRVMRRGHLLELGGCGRLCVLVYRHILRVVQAQPRQLLDLRHPGSLSRQRAPAAVAICCGAEQGLTDLVWVAEKSRVCRSIGRFCTIAFTAAEKPCGSMEAQ